MINLLVITEGPPPLGDTIAEGGALRAWGLAKGFAAHGHKVTLAYRSTYTLGANNHKTIIPHGIQIKTWDGNTLDSLIANHKIIVLRYAMGEAEEIVRRLKPWHILVSDSYIPISIEVSARNSSDNDEHMNFLRLQETSAIASRRADYFLYASPAQKNYYLGYLSALNKINPTTYPLFSKRMFEVPYGVDPSDTPIKYQKIHSPSSPALLWYGAFYSWFDMESLVDSMIQLKKEMPDFKLLIAGAKNPYNKDPGLLAHYEKTMRSINKLGDSVELIGWTPYDERFEIYSRATAIITFNHFGLENELAWRTRLMDYILARKPIITNGGDPLGEDLINRNIAYRANENSVSDVFKKIVQETPNMEKYSAAIKRYSWEHITKEISRELNTPSNLPSVKMIHKDSTIFTLKKRTKRILRLPFNFLKYLRKYGFIKTLKRITRGA